MADSADDGQQQLPQGDFITWLQGCHDAVSKLNVNLETMTVCLRNISRDINTLIGLMDGRPLNPLGGQGQSLPPTMES